MRLFWGDFSTLCLLAWFFFVLKITSNAFLEFLFYQFLSFDLSQFFFHSFPQNIRAIYVILISPKFQFARSWCCKLELACALTMFFMVFLLFIAKCSWTPAAPFFIISCIVVWKFFYRLFIDCCLLSRDSNMKSLKLGLIWRSVL